MGGDYLLLLIKKGRGNNVLPSRPTIMAIQVVDFLISTKVRLRRMEHLHKEEIICPELYFRAKTKGLDF